MPRYSALKHDAGYANYLLAREFAQLSVRLDGVLVKSVVTADEEAGLVVIHALDADGQRTVRDGGYVLVALHGKVEVQLQPQGQVH